MTIQHIKLTLYLHREAVNRILDLERRIGIKMAETTTKIRCTPHLPHQPGHALRTHAGVLRQEGIKLLSEIDKNSAGLKHARGLRCAVVHQCRNFGIGVGTYKARGKLIALADIDNERVILRALVTERQKLFQHHGNFHPVRRGKRIKLERMFANGQIFLMCRA